MYSMRSDNGIVWHCGCSQKEKSAGHQLSSFAAGSMEDHSMVKHDTRSLPVVTGVSNLSNRKLFSLLSLIGFCLYRYFVY